MTMLVGDAKLKREKALPNGAGSVNTDGIDLGHNASGAFLARCEFLLTAPALTTTELPDAQTMTYIVQHAWQSDFSDAATLLNNVIVQTGAGGAGAPTAELRFCVPSDVRRHVRARATKSGAGNASGKSMTLDLLF